MTTVIGFAGYSNSGKTTLISKMVQHFAERGIRAAVIKHDAHGHYKEAPGADSSLYREAGAAATVVVSPDSYITFRKTPVSVSLEHIVNTLRDESFDLIFVEGFKNGSHDKIALFRNEDQAEILRLLPTAPVAAAAPAVYKDLVPAAVPFFEADDISGLAVWIEKRMKKNKV
ncbi:MAG: molybdopterin-guanine dinucleotide biosynthesis protein [Paenibacillus sp.]|jgi:molybdopterin-guanine dinucleotide biosynthesis protein B|nr:molybdopterin-guanine dinucleotide biosynthesis protein [Paenibacillus sp.]